MLNGTSEVLARGTFENGSRCARAQLPRKLFAWGIKRRPALTGEGVAGVTHDDDTASGELL
jgi:hypothetical protein